MSRLFDTVIIVDWSARATPSPAKPSTDAIWIGAARDGDPATPLYFRTRAAAMADLGDRVAAERAEGRRVLLGFDFPFGYPRGFAAAVAGAPRALAVWAEIDARVTDDAANRNNRFDAAAALNALLPGVGPFWGRPERPALPGLPARGRLRDGACGLPERRHVEAVVPRAQPVWKLYTTGSVGGQALTGIPWLRRLRADPRFAADTAVWPFETGLDVPRTAVVLAEIYPSLLAAEVEARMTAGAVKDAVQVAVTAEALARLDRAGELAPLFAPQVAPELAAEIAAEEGWILGAGFEAALRGAARPDPPRPRLRDDCFALPAGVDWIPVDEALARLRDGLAPVAGVETAPIAAAGGRILAAPLQAQRASPPAANSAVDGYGFAHAAMVAAGGALRLAPGRAAAGAPLAGPVPPGAALRILTGAILPEGVDTVVLQEDVTPRGETLLFEPRLRPGANTRPQGEDVGVGARIAEAGDRLAPQHLALAAAVGLATAEVRRPLRVAVLSTGDELADPDPGLAPHRVADANRPMLLEMLRRWDMAAVDLGRVGDRPDTIAAALSRGAVGADAILTTGGASAGDEDHVSRLLQERGALTTWRIAVKPGRPLALGRWNEVPLFGLPGNPVAAFVCALVFARPALLTLAGAPWSAPAGREVPAAFAKRKKAGRREYLRARLNAGGAAEVFASEGSGRISGLVWARGLVELEDGARDIAPGDPVRYMAFSDYGL